MKDTIKKLEIIRDQVLEQKVGVLYLLALISRVDIEGKSDLILSSSWLEKSNAENDLVYVIDKLKKEFNNNLDFLSRIVLLQPSELFVRRLARAIYRENDGCTGELVDLKITDNFVVKKVNVIAINFSKIDLSSDDSEDETPFVVGDVANF
jgi:hypothetical protein